jgi:hypothetical protein
MIAGPIAYTTVYDEAVRCMPNLSVFVPAVIIFVAGLILVVLPALPLPLGSFRRRARYSGLAMLVGVVAWSALVATSEWRQERALCQAVRTGHFDVVEGVVSNYRPATQKNRGRESWDIESGARLRHYAYSSANLVGYRRTASQGGRIGDGVHVRIADVDGVIVRLDVAISDTAQHGRPE